MSESPDEAMTDTAEAPVENPLFTGIAADTFPSLGHPDEVPGEPERTDAVETSEAPESPEGEPETPTASGNLEETPEPEQPVNFDGFDDETKATYKRLLEEGHITQGFIDAQRTNTMFHADYTRKRMAEADREKQRESEQDEFREDRRLLEQIRGDDNLHAAWLKMSKGEATTEDEDADELVDKRSAAEIARAEAQRILNAAEAAKQKEVDDYAARAQAVQGVLLETMKQTGVSEEVFKGYMNIEEALLPAGTDPVRDLEPADIQRRLLVRHEAESAKVREAKLKEQLEQRTSRDVRSAKQSLPPSKRVAPQNILSLAEQTFEDMGLPADGSGVSGFGNP